MSSAACTRWPAGRTRCWYCLHREQRCVGGGAPFAQNVVSFSGQPAGGCVEPMQVGAEYIGLHTPSSGAPSVRMQNGLPCVRCKARRNFSAGLCLGKGQSRRWHGLGAAAFGVEHGGVRGQKRQPARAQECRFLPSGPARVCPASGSRSSPVQGAFSALGSSDRRRSPVPTQPQQVVYGVLVPGKGITTSGVSSWRGSAHSAPYSGCCLQRSEVGEVGDVRQQNGCIQWFDGPPCCPAGVARNPHPQCPPSGRITPAPAAAFFFQRW